ncbi:hypothetical protein Tco_0886887 [Tanacetum coccineum]
MPRKWTVMEGWGGIVQMGNKKKKDQEARRSSSVAVDKSFGIERCLGERQDNLHRYLKMKEQETPTANIPDLQTLPTSVTRNYPNPRNGGGIQKNTKEKPIHIQSMSTQLVPSKELQEPWKQPPSKMLSQHSQKSMKSCDTKHKFVVEKDQETTTSKMYGPISPLKPSKLEDYYRKPKNFLIYNDTQSNNSDDDDIIVDPGWDDFCLEAAKLPRMEAHRL